MAPPKIVYEFYICQQMGGWTLDYVRNMGMSEILKILRLCLTYDSIKRKWEAELASAGLAKKTMA